MTSTGFIVDFPHFSQKKTDQHVQKQQIPSKSHQGAGVRCDKETWKLGDPRNCQPPKM